MGRIKKRLDQVLVEKGLVENRQRARAMIMAGMVKVDGKTVDKPGHLVSPSCVVGLTGKDHPYVSRGGIKLDAALNAFGINVEGLVMLDVGTSTGGFTDCLLQYGAKTVVAVDVGYGQLAWRLRTDPRVVIYERTNIRHLKNLDVEDSIDGAVIDTSFISLRIVVPATLRHLKTGSFIVALVKPQFEAGKELVGKGGVIRDESLHRDIIHNLIECFQEKDLEVQGTIESPIRGAKGNREYFLYLIYTKNQEKT